MDSHSEDQSRLFKGVERDEIVRFYIITGANSQKNWRISVRRESEICAAAQQYDNLFLVFYRSGCPPDIRKGQAGTPLRTLKSGGANF